MTKTVAVGDVELSDVLADVKKRTEVVLTEDGRPVARVIPIENEERMRTLEEMRGSVRILGDIVEPIADEWDVMK